MPKNRYAAGALKPDAAAGGPATLPVLVSHHVLLLPLVLPGNRLSHHVLCLSPLSPWSRMLLLGVPGHRQSVSAIMSLLSPGRLRAGWCCWGSQQIPSSCHPYHDCLPYCRLGAGCCCWGSRGLSPIMISSRNRMLLLGSPGTSCSLGALRTGWCCRGSGNRQSLSLIRFSSCFPCCNF